MGFGVSKSPVVPPGFTALSGHDDPYSPNYGNYQYADGSVMVWVPKFYYLVHNGDVLPVNTIEIRGTDYFATTAAANAAGYALHRAFIDGGVEKAGFFFDKYKASKAASGTGWIASSIANGNPISTSSAHNPIADLTASGGTNAYYRAIDAAHARDGVNGAVNANSIFHVGSRFQYAALATLSLVSPVLSKDEEIKELCTIDGVTYVAATETVVFAKQPAAIKFTPVDGAALKEQLVPVLAKIDQALPQTATINAQVVAKIRERYSVDDEIKMLRIAPAPEAAAWNDYVEQCLEWGRREKAKLGLTKTAVAPVSEAMKI
jgi:hypothetical protein